MEAKELSRGMRVKTRGRDIVKIESVRYFNDTVCIQPDMKEYHPTIIVSAEEIREIIEE